MWREAEELVLEGYNAKKNKLFIAAFEMEGGDKPRNTTSHQRLEKIREEIFPRVSRKEHSTPNNLILAQ